MGRGRTASNAVQIASPRATMRIAALDIGSNSFHLIVSHVNPGGRMEILDRAKEMVRFGETLKSGMISPDVFRRGLDALRALSASPIATNPTRSSPSRPAP